MNAMLWVLLLEDILFLVIIGALLFLRQRAYAALAAILFAIILLTNFAILLGFSSWWILVLPLLLSGAIMLLGRPFLPRARVTMGEGMTRGVAIASLFVFLSLTALFVVALLFNRR